MTQPQDHKPINVVMPDARGAQVGERNTQINNLINASIEAQVSWPVVIGRVPRQAEAYQERPGLWRALSRALTTDGSASVAHVLTGDGGTGKTQLAATAFNQAADRDLRIWISATSREAIIGTYAQAAAVIRPGYGSGGASAEERATAFLEWLTSTQRSWLVVLDDLSDPVYIREWWPHGPSGQVIITTRRRDAELTGPRYNIIAVDVFTPEEAVSYFAEKLSTARDRGDLPATVLSGAEELATVLERLPVALAQAAAVIVDDGITCTEYLIRFRDRMLSLRELFPSDARADDYQHTIATTWSLAIRQAESIRPKGLAPLALELTSVLDANGIPEQLMTTRAVLSFLERARKNPEAAPVTAEEARAAVRALHRLSLVTHHPRGGSKAITTHALVQRATLETLDANALVDAIQAAADALLEVWPAVESDPDFGQVLRINALSLSARYLRALWLRGAHLLLFRTGRSLGEMGLFNTARDYFTDMLRTAKDLLGEDHPDTLLVRNDQAFWRGRAGDPGGAACAFEELVADCVQVLGPDHPVTLGARNNLARWRGRTGDAAGAAALLERLEADCFRVLGPDHPDTLATRHDLARWRGEAGDPVGAVRASEQLLSDRLRVLGPDSRRTLATRQNIAHWRGEAGDVEGAIEAFEQLLADRSRVLGPDHPETLLTRSYLARWRGEGEGPDRAVAMLEDLILDQRRVLGLDHPHTLATRHDLAWWRGQAGDVVSAIAALRNLVMDQIRILGPEHPDTLSTQKDLAYIEGSKRGSS